MGANGRSLNAQDLMLGDVDLDHFLDNYLVQLQQNDGQQSAAPVPGINYNQGRTMLPDHLGANQGNVGLDFGQHAGLQGSFHPGFSGMSMAQGHMNMAPNNPLTGIAFLQQQQQALQQQARQPQFGLGMPGMAQAGAAAPLGGAGGRAASSHAAGATKPKAKGKATGKQTQNQKEAESCSGSDSDGDGSSEEEPRNRKRQATGAGGAVDDAERRHQALQEKNRRAQRRFRERQKTKLQELHKQIEELTTKVSSLQSENASLYSRTNILEKVLDMRNEQIQVMQETKEATGHLEDDPASLQGVNGQLVQLTPENIKELGSEQILKIYQMYVKELSVRLMEDGKPPDSAPERLHELEVLVQDLSMLIMRLGVIKPLETRKFIVLSRQYLGSTESEVIELWKTVMKLIELSDQQKREVVDMKRSFLQKIDPIMEERKLLNIQIQSNLPHDTFATKNALTYIKAHEAVIKLRDNLRSEQHIVLEFAITVFRDVFKPVQMAALLVKCYPAVPDALGIASALATDLGEPDLPHARQLTMQLGGYLEGSSLMADGNAGLMAGNSLMNGGGVPATMDGMHSLSGARASSSMAGPSSTGFGLSRPMPGAFGSSLGLQTVTGASARSALSHNVSDLSGGYGP